jgi:hypothetical protein
MNDDLEQSIRAVAIVAEMNKAIKEGSFKHLQEMMSDLGYRIELRKPKKSKKQLLQENGYDDYDQ